MVIQTIRRVDYRYKQEGGPKPRLAKNGLAPS